MILVDVHAHLNHKAFSTDLAATIDRARQAGVKSIIVNGVNHATNQEVIAMSEEYDIVNAALGLYPLDGIGFKIDSPDESGLTEDAKVDVDATLQYIEENKDKIVGLGEIGLDYKWTKEAGQIKKQKENFQKFIELSEKINKPLIIHSRNAESDVLDMLETSKAKAILHSFGGKKSLMKRGADPGVTFSIPPVITRLQHFSTLVEIVDINQLLTETDCPYLGPVPNERNEPANVIESIKKIAEIKSFDVEEVAKNIWLNYQNLFS